MNCRIFVFLLLLLSLVSCETLIENIANNIEYDNYTSPYAGTYIGTYSGQDSGTLKITVDSKDIVTATRYSTVFKMEENLYGGMIGPALHQVSSRESGFKITGSFISQTRTFTGSWSQNGISGTWSVTKQWFFNYLSLIVPDSMLIWWYSINSYIWKLSKFSAILYGNLQIRT